MGVEVSLCWADLWLEVWTPVFEYILRALLLSKSLPNMPFSWLCLREFSLRLICRYLCLGVGLAE